METSLQASYAEASRDCEANGDHLLYMETTTEVENVTRWLKSSDSTGSLYFVGGRYDVLNSQFIWENNVPLREDAPWAPDEPKDKKPNTRLGISAVGREVQLTTVPNTSPTRYICEGRSDNEGAEDVPQLCPKKNDLVIVLDSSGSIQEEQYSVAKEFVRRLATTWVHDESGSRVAVLIFSDVAETVFSLSEAPDPDLVMERIGNMRHIRSNSLPLSGIELAMEEFKNNERNVTQNMVILTDGGIYPTAHKNETRKAVLEVIDSGIRIFTVGIGTSIDHAELLEMAGGVRPRVYIPNQFDEVLYELKSLSRKLCF